MVGFAGRRYGTGAAGVTRERYLGRSDKRNGAAEVATRCKLCSEPMFRSIDAFPIQRWSSHFCSMLLRAVLSKSEVAIDEMEGTGASRDAREDGDHPLRRRFPSAQLACGLHGLAQAPGTSYKRLTESLGGRPMLLPPSQTASSLLLSSKPPHRFSSNCAALDRLLTPQRPDTRPWAHDSAAATATGIGEGEVLELLGPPGVGKTRTAMAFAITERRRDDAGHVLVIGTSRQ